MPAVVEPGRAADSGGYGIACGYGSAGTLGSVALPFQCLVTAYRPFPFGAPAWLGAPGAPGAPVAGSAGTIQGQVSDAEIYAATAGVMPIATIAWTAISN